MTICNISLEKKLKISKSPLSRISLQATRTIISKVKNPKKYELLKSGRKRDEEKKRLITTWKLWSERSQIYFLSSQSIILITDCHPYPNRRANCHIYICPLQFYIFTHPSSLISSDMTKEIEANLEDTLLFKIRNEMKLFWWFPRKENNPFILMTHTPNLFSSEQVFLFRSLGDLFSNLPSDSIHHFPSTLFTRKRMTTRLYQEFRFRWQVIIF